jgi:hypothetical protein
MGTKKGELAQNGMSEAWADGRCPEFDIRIYLLPIRPTTGGPKCEECSARLAIVSIPFSQFLSSPLYPDIALTFWAESVWS